jgi:hypothetical protein
MKFNELIDLIENGNENNYSEASSIVEEQAEEISSLREEVKDLEEKLEEYEDGEAPFRISTGRDVISIEFEKGNLLDTQIIEAVKVLMENKNSVKVLQLLEKLSNSSILN